MAGAQVVDAINLKLDIFEGPLDLLLHLIQDLEIDIYDIPIAEITEQYMEFIHAMKTLELEVAGEYLVMAATLMAIKSQLLLPKPEVIYDYEEEVGEDPRDALVQQLLEYRKYKYAAEVLAEKETERQLHFAKPPQDLTEYEETLAPLPAGKFNSIDLFLALHDVLKRQRQHVPQAASVGSETISITEKVQQITLQVKKLAPGASLTLTELFVHYTKEEVVTTFMALLELMKKQIAQAVQHETYGPIVIAKGALA